MKKVAIFGGGMAGLAVAHELVHRGFTVDVYESAAVVGGKSASQDVSGLPAPTPGPYGPRRAFLGEHGFRFFPGFYFNVIATMSEIPRPAAHGGGVVADDLVESPQAAMAYPALNGVERFYPFDRKAALPSWDVYGRLRALLDGLGFTTVDLARMAWFRLKYLSAGPSRRLQWDDTSWHDFIELDSPHYSPGFRDFETSIPRTMSAMAAKTTSAMIVGNIGMQFGLGYARPGNREDRLLVGPTNYRWLQPWFDYLASNAVGVSFHTQHELVSLTYVKGSQTISSAVVQPLGGASFKVAADYYVAALPLDVVQQKITADMANDDPQLAKLQGINPATATSWMAGAQFFLKRDVPMVGGHVFYPQTPWALTSVSQAQFWNQNQSKHSVADSYGDGTVKGVISAIISDWTKPSDVTGKAAQDYQESEIPKLLDEVRRQMRDSLPGQFDLSSANIAGQHLDDAIQLVNATRPVPSNNTRLLVHPLNGYMERPLAQGTIDNLFLAGDYVRTSTGLATMESANEAARMAVNALLAADGGTYLPCPIWTLQEDAFFAPVKQMDELRKARGLPHVLDSCPIRFLKDAGLIDWAQELFKVPAAILLPG